MKFTDEQRKDIENKLLTAGIYEFGMKGIKAVTVDTLVKQAGISKGMFYKFFESKEIFFFKCLEHVEEKAKQEKILPALLADGSALDNLKNLFINISGFIEDYPILAILNDSEQFNYLQSRIPPEIMKEHIKNDDSSAQEFITGLKAKGIQLNYSAQFISALLRLLAMLPLFKKQVGTLFNETREFIIDAAVRKLLSNEMKEN